MAVEVRNGEMRRGKAAKVRRGKVLSGVVRPVIAARVRWVKARSGLVRSGKAAMERLERRVYMNPRAQRAIDRLLKLEGGYVNDPSDHGGETKYGISKRTYPHLDIRALTTQQAAEIYYRDWWHRYRYDEVASDVIAFRLLDMSVVAGPRASHKAIQKAVNKLLPVLIVDGKLGNMSILAINELTHTHGREADLVKMHKRKCIEYFQRLNNPRYEKGWINRVNTPVEV